MEVTNLGLITLGNAFSRIQDKAKEGQSFLVVFEDKKTGCFHEISYTVKHPEIKTEKDGSKWKRIYD